MSKFHTKDFKIAFLMFSIAVSIAVFFLSVSTTSSSTYNVHDERIHSQASVNLTVSSETAAFEDGSYLVGSEILFELDDAGYGNVSIKFKGTTRSFPYTMTKSPTGKWFYEWNTQIPFTGDLPVDPGEYDIVLTIDDVVTACNPAKIIIANEPLNPIIIILLIGIIAGVGVGALAIVKVRGSSKKKGDKLEFGTVVKTQSKKKGTVYKGASSIGKRSGQIAETKSKSKTAALETSGSPSETDQKPHFKAIKSAFGVDHSKNITEPINRQLMPSDASYKFETKTASSAAMIKNMELKMDIKSKVNFLSSKVNSLLSNIEFFKAILLQQEQEELACPTCNKKANKYWIVCPHCEIQEHDSELGLQQSLMSIGGDVRFCPNCKRIVQPSWSECPYCFIKDK